jgi:putative DNA primase/helicase
MTETHIADTMAPEVLGVEPDGIPSYLKERPQWVLWSLEERDEKYTKVPVDVWTGGLASSTDLMTWAAFDQAYAVYATDEDLCGVGFVFCSGDPFVGIDLDNCRNAETGAVEAWAERILSRFLGAYVEASPSGTGVHIITRGKLAGGGANTRSVEMYDLGRFFAVTGVAI